MEFKKIIFILVITTTIVFACMFGTSYAYYTYNNGTNLNITTGDFDAGVAVIFSQNEYINLKTGIPITQSEIATKASTSTFTLVPDQNLLNGYEVAININIANVKIAEELRVADFKYDIKCNDGSSDVATKEGTGTDFTDDVVNSSNLSLVTLSTSDNTFNITKTYTCTFRVWLQESGTSQNNLMNKKFSGLMKINSAYRK